MSDHPPTTTSKTVNDGAPRQRRWPIEVALFAAMLLVYQASRALVVGDEAVALKNAFDVIDLEKVFGLHFESSIQGWMLDNLHLTQTLNQFYIWAHLPVTAIFFIWLYRRRRAVYPFVRNAFFVTNVLALAVFVAFPVAPPRMLSGEGFVDTLSLISGIDLHQGNLSGWFNPYAAVPSMHFGYALMVGVITALLARNYIVKALALMYPALVFFTIVGTANHYVVDALAGGLVLAAAFLLTWFATRRVSALQERKATRRAREESAHDARTDAVEHGPEPLESPEVTI